MPNSHNQVYCSYECSYKEKRKRIIKSHKKYPEHYKKRNEEYNMNRKIKMFEQGVRVLCFEKVTCEVCGNMFEPNTAIKKYCSKKCSDYIANKDKIIKRQNNLEYFRMMGRKHYYADHKHSRKIRNKNSALRRMKNPLILKQINISSLMREYFFKNKNHKKAEKILGVNREFYKKYLEEKFTKGMCWDNYGFRGWHIDHVIPLISAKNEEELINLFHYTNTQPLWAVDNISKGCKSVCKN